MATRQRQYILFADGGKVVFDDYFKDNFPKFVAFAGRFQADLWLCEDMVEDVFVQIYESKDGFFASELALTAWIYKVIQRKILDNIKHLRVEEKYSRRYLDARDEDTYFIKSVMEEEARYLLYQAINTLSPQCREVVRQVLKDKKNQEIADELGISIVTVKSHKMLAYRKLKEILSKLLVVLLFINS